MHMDLSSHLHIPECNELIAQLKTCHKDYWFRKFVGHCNSIDDLMLNCLKKERLARRQRNFEKSFAKDSVESNLSSEFLSVSERYYEHKYCTKFTVGVRNLDQRISFHTNRVCMISLADNHTVVKNKEKIVKINCAVDDKIDRSMNATSGKGKRGAQKLSSNSILCYVECENGESYPVYSCVTGKLLEVNKNLIDDPQLMISKPISEGYIALILPVLNLYGDIKNSMLSSDEYFNKMY